jgi:hypothetical protein
MQVKGLLKNFIEIFYITFLLMWLKDFEASTHNPVYKLGKKNLNSSLIR